MPETFGKLNYLIALVTLVSPMMAMGLNSIISRELLKRPKDRNIILGSAITMRASAALAVGPLAVWLGYSFLEKEDSSLFAFLIFSAFFNSLFIVEFYLQAYVANRYAVLLRLFTLIIFSSARIIAVAYDAGLPLFIYLAGFEGIVLGLFYISLYGRLTGGLGYLRVSVQESKKLFLDSRWLILSGAAAVVYLKIDQIMLASFIGDHAVGIYAAAARISEVWYFIPAAIATSYFPQLLSKRENDPSDYNADLQKLNDFLFAISFAIAAVITISAEWIVPLLFGQAYADSARVLVVHIWVSIFVFMRSLLSKWLIAENFLKLSMISQVFGAIANVFLNIKLIPAYGPVGAAYATVISYAVTGYIVLFFHKDLRPMALVVSRSIILPYRFARRGFKIYKA